MGGSSLFSESCQQQPFRTDGIARPIGSLPPDDLKVGGVQLGETRHFVKPNADSAVRRWDERLTGCRNGWRRYE